MHWTVGSLVSFQYLVAFFQKPGVQPSNVWQVFTTTDFVQLSLQPVSVMVMTTFREKDPSADPALAVTDSPSVAPMILPPPLIDHWKVTPVLGVGLAWYTPDESIQ